MNAEQVREFYNAQPFRPFSLHLADGRSLSVVHREFMALDPRGRTVFVYRPDGAFNVCDVMLITDIEVAAPDEVASNGNGPGADGGNGPPAANGHGAL